MRNFKIIPADTLGGPQVFCVTKESSSGEVKIWSEHKTRREAEIACGNIWTVHTHESITPEKTFFEGTRAACLKWLRDNRLFKAYRKGQQVRLGQTIWEESGVTV
jgi:hypothetical protein